MTYILITGASSGIGKTFAEIYASKNKNLILVARSEQKLNELSEKLKQTFGIDVRVFVQDLSKQDSAEKVFAFSKEFDVELLINNAGFGLAGEFKNQSLTKLEEMISLNITSLVKLTHLFLPKFIAKKSGGVINVASTASFQPVPHLGVYAATKSFVQSFSEALHEELRGTGVKVLSLCPGGTETSFFDAAEYHRKKMLIPMQQSDVVVQTAISAYENDSALVVSGFMNKMMVFSSRLFPRIVVRKIAGIFFKQD